MHSHDFKLVRSSSHIGTSAICSSLVFGINVHTAMRLVYAMTKLIIESTLYSNRQLEYGCIVYMMKCYK